MENLDSESHFNDKNSSTETQKIRISLIVIVRLHKTWKWRNHNQHKLFKNYSHGKKVSITY